jgi:hypothetical protein
MDRETIERIDDAVAFADASAHPSPNDLYDDIYVLGDQVRGWYSVDERTSTPHRGEDERSMSESLPGQRDYERTMGAPEADEPPEMGRE